MSIFTPTAMDPAHPGTPIRAALLLESLFNLPFTYICLARPHLILSHLRTTSSTGIPSTGGHDPAALGLVQIVGTATAMVTVLLLGALPNYRGAVACRKVVYAGVAAAEVGMGVLFVRWWAAAGDSAVGWKKHRMRSAAVNMAVLVAWRLGSMLLRPGWYGRYAEEEEGKVLGKKE